MSQITTNDESRARATALYLIQAIVDKHGGTLTVDLATDEIIIEVSDEHEAACVQEITDQVGAMVC